MSMRVFLQKNGVWVAVAALVLAGIIAFISTRKTDPAKQWGSFNTIKAYYMDEGTQQISVRPYTDVPPLEGGKVVRAVYITNTGPGEKRLAYLEKYTDQVKQIMEEKIRNGEEPAEEGEILAGHLVRAADGGEWYPISSPKGTQIVSNAIGGKPPQYVWAK